MKLVEVTHPQYPPKAVPEDVVEKFVLFGWEAKLPDLKKKPEKE